MPASIFFNKKLALIKDIKYLYLIKWNLPSRTCVSKYVQMKSRKIQPFIFGGQWINIDKILFKFKNQRCFGISEKKNRWIFLIHVDTSAFTQYLGIICKQKISSK